MLLFASCSSQPSSSLPATTKRLLCGSLRCATDKQMASVEEHLDDVEWFLRDRSDTMSSRVKHAHVHSARFGSKTTDFIKLVSGHNTKPVTALLPVTPKREALKVLEIQRNQFPEPVVYGGLLSCRYVAHVGLTSRRCNVQGAHAIRLSPFRTCRRMALLPACPLRKATSISL